MTCTGSSSFGAYGHPVVCIGHPRKGQHNNNILLWDTMIFNSSSFPNFGPVFDIRIVFFGPFWFCTFAFLFFSSSADGPSSSQIGPLTVPSTPRLPRWCDSVLFWVFSWRPRAASGSAVDFFVCFLSFHQQHISTVFAHVTAQCWSACSLLRQCRHTHSW